MNDPLLAVKRRRAEFWKMVEPIVVQFVVGRGLTAGPSFHRINPVFVIGEFSLAIVERALYVRIFFWDEVKIKVYAEAETHLRMEKRCRGAVVGWGTLPQDLERLPEWLKIGWEIALAFREEDLVPALDWALRIHPVLTPIFAPERKEETSE